MRIIRPLEVTPDRLLSSNVPEDDAPLWVSTATYTTGEEVMHELRMYEALVDVPAGVEPGAEAVTESSPAKWLDLGAINRWRMFDDRVESQTAQEDTVSVSIRPGQVVNSLALLNLDAISATVTMTDAVEGVVFEREESLVDAGVTNWYDWYFSPIGRRSDIVVLDMPAYGTADVSVTVNASSGEIAAVGHLVIGSVVDIGVAQYGTNVGIIDFSRKERDVFGNTLIVERSFSKRAEFDVWLPNNSLGIVQRLLASLRTQPVVWIGEESLEGTIVFGFYRDFDITISGPEFSDAIINVEGLV
jgi:hypothetical protein